MENSNWQIVEQHLNAWKNKNFSNVSYVHDLQFQGPIDRFTNSRDFIAKASQVAQMVTDIKVRQKFINGNTVAVFYDFVTSTPVGSMYIADLYELENGLIKRVDTVFDPRAIVEFMSQMQQS